MRCDYCYCQGISAEAVRLKGKDAVTVYSGTVRYGCENGHKFAVPIENENRRRLRRPEGA